MLLIRLRVTGLLSKHKKVANKNISGRLKPYIRSKNVLHLSNKYLSKTEVSLLSKGLNI